MYKFFKRILDILVSSIAVILLSPILVPIMIGLKISGEGYVFYKQRRIGLNNKYFYMLKFATMLKDSPNIGTGSITLRDDFRVTPMGKFLRKTKINELPQLMNIILGEISLVGPRPLVDETFNVYPEEIKELIYRAKPGLTGIGSIIFRDEERILSDCNSDPIEFYKNQIAPYKGSLELWYQENASFSLDLKIIFMTAQALVFSKSQLIYKVFKNLPTRPEFLNK